MTESNEMKLSVYLAADPARVFRALVEPSELKSWLATEASVDLSEGGVMTLVSGTPYCSGTHTIRAVAPGERLALDWSIAGRMVPISFGITSHGEGTSLEVAVQVADDLGDVIPEKEGAKSAMMETWAYNAGLLKTWLERGEAMCRLSPERKPSTSIVHEVTIRVPPQQVFAALVEPEQIAKWNTYADKPKVEPKVGGRYSFGWSSEGEGTDGPGEIVEFEAGKKITYSWHGDPPTLVSWTVEPLPGAPNATKVTLVHSGFITEQNMLAGYNLGWPGFVYSLAEWLEHGELPKMFP